MVPDTFLKLRAATISTACEQDSQVALAAVGIGRSQMREDDRSIEAYPVEGVVREDGDVVP